MPSRITNPFWQGANAVDDARRIVKNNAQIECVWFDVESDETWLPLILSQLGFFPSNSDVKRNRPDLWRDRFEHDFVKLQWAEVWIEPIAFRPL